MMDTDTERTLQNLCVLGALSHNDKLMTGEGTFNIYAPTPMRGAVRKWYGENRAHNLERIGATVRAGLQYALARDEEPFARNDSAAGRARVMRRKRMVLALTRASRGLTNLMETYRDDAATLSQLSLLVQEVNDSSAVAMEFLEGSSCESPPSSAWALDVRPRVDARAAP